MFLSVLCTQHVGVLSASGVHDLKLPCEEVQDAESSRAVSAAAARQTLDITTRHSPSPFQPFNMGSLAADPTDKWELFVQGVRVAAGSTS